MFALSLPHVIAIVCLLASVLGAGVWWWSDRRLRASEPPDCAPITLWGCLCKAHDLSSDESARLMELSHSAGLTDPCLVFVDPRCLQQAAAANDGAAPEFAHLGRRLFGDLFQEAQG
jgi:hypothetical protein